MINKDLLTRAITALIFVPVMLGGLFGGPYLYTLLFFIVLVTCSLEYYQLIYPKEQEQHRFRRYYGVFLSCLLYTIVAFSYLFPDFKFNPPAAVVMVLTGSFLAFIYELFRVSDSPFTHIAQTLSGILYIGVPMTFTLFLYFGESPEFTDHVLGFLNRPVYTNHIVIGLIVMNWLSDTGAYLGGRAFGKTPLFPRISPKKTWEGTISGVITLMIAAYIFSLFWTEIALIHWLGLGVVVAVFGGLGDLVESMLKRSKGVKDSGKFLPGHGGMLDRFDAFIFLLPFASAYVYFFMG